MSISAFKIKIIGTKKEKSFSLNDEKVMKLIEPVLFPSLNNDCCGVGTISIKKLKEIVDNDIEEDVRQNLLNDIKEAEASNYDYVEYYCY